MICDACKIEVERLLDERIKLILYDRDAGEYPGGIAESICFHLMELKERIRSGK